MRSATPIALFLLLAYAPFAFGHEGHEHGDSLPETNLATGVVFHDQNSNGNRDEGEPGIKGVRVSNGKAIVKTDVDGRYKLMISNDSIIFVIKPRNWQTPLNDSNLPQFYYIHKPKGSPKSKFPGVDPTGPLPDSIDFPLAKSKEPDQFSAIMFGDPQPRNNKEVDYISHDVIEQIVAAKGHGASLGVTLGDIVFDDLDVMSPLNQAIALIGIPWYNVIGNHDLNTEATSDHLSDETFERVYGPAYYSFEHGPVHFMVLDDVNWHRPEGKERSTYKGGLGSRQMQFIKNDLAMIPKDQLVVLLMHIPLIDVEDRRELYDLIQDRPFSVSLSAHTHYMKHQFIGEEDGWKGEEKHHHIINVTVCGSWWRGAPDERGIPHATMSDGGPNGYSIMTFDGHKYSLDFHAAARPDEYQMNIYADNVIPQGTADATLSVNVFNGSEQSKVQFRVGSDGKWSAMNREASLDPALMETRSAEEALTNRTFVEVPSPKSTPHMWHAKLPANLEKGTHLIEVRTTDMFGKTYTDQRILRVTE